MTRPYHHGNLRWALVTAGVDIARRNGPSALSVRDLARATGVSPSAAYRHFPDLDHMIAEVARLARQELAQSMIDARDAVPDQASPSDWALARFAATGAAYIDFAKRETNIFETAFILSDAPPSQPDVPSPWDVLADELDDLVTTGILTPALRAEAPVVAWGVVHGVASILVRNAFPDATTDEFATNAAIMAVFRALELDHLK